MLSIGEAALEALRSSASGVVFGRTSRGDFIKLDHEEIVFLSFESYRGPLTANIKPVEAICSRIQTGDRVTIDARGIYWPGYGWTLNIPPGKAWAAPPPVSYTKLPDEIRTTLIEIVGGLFSIREASSISANLMPWLGFGLADHPKPTPVLELPDFEGASSSEISRKLQEFFFPLIGLGGGLTPSGDDLILGFGLAAQRWSSMIHRGFEVNDLTPLLLKQVNDRTTLLSRSLIREAWHGQADERLILALDGIVTGNSAHDQIVNALASWGNHSGGDAMTGFALFLLTLG